MHNLVPTKTSAMRYDAVIPIIPGKLWQSGYKVNPDLADQFDAVISVADTGNEQAWLEEWKLRRREAWQKAWEKRVPELVTLPISAHFVLIDHNPPRNRPRLPPCLDRFSAELAALMVVALVRQGRRVLVHCTGGNVRSKLICVLALARLERLTGQEAYKRVQLILGLDPDMPFSIWDYNEMIGEWPLEE